MWQGKSIQDPITNVTFCVYDSDVATGYGVGAFLFLLSSESLLMGVTKCMCFGRPLAPGSDRAWSIIYFISSWSVPLALKTNQNNVIFKFSFLLKVIFLLKEFRFTSMDQVVLSPNPFFMSKFDDCRMTFLVAEACVIAGATKNAYHTKYLSAQTFSCESLRKGIFIAGAVFIVATMVLNVYFYMYFTKSVSSPPAHKANRSGSHIGMAGYA